MLRLCQGGDWLRHEDRDEVVDSQLKELRPVVSMQKGSISNIYPYHSLFYATADEAVAYMFYRCFGFFCFFFRPSDIRQPFSGTAERIFMKLLPNDTGEMEFATSCRRLAKVVHGGCVIKS